MTASGARVNNWGSRIDLILAAHHTHCQHCLDSRLGSRLDSSSLPLPRAPSSRQHSSSSSLGNACSTPAPTPVTVPTSAWNYAAPSQPTPASVSESVPLPVTACTTPASGSRLTSRHGLDSAQAAAASDGEGIPMVGSDQGMDSDTRLVGTLSESRHLSGSGLCHESQQQCEHTLGRSEGACNAASGHEGCLVKRWLVAAVSLTSCVHRIFVDDNVFLLTMSFGVYHRFMRDSVICMECHWMSAAHTGQTRQHMVRFLHAYTTHAMRGGCRRPHVHMTSHDVTCFPSTQNSQFPQHTDSLAC